MISNSIIAILLLAPLVTLIIPSIDFWKEYKKENSQNPVINKATYNRFFLIILAVGVLCMWIAWLGGITIMITHENNLLSSTKLKLSSILYNITQIIGLIIFYTGAITYNLVLIFAGKSVRPAPAGITDDHILIKSGPFSIVRHPLYISYILIIFGLSLLLHIYWFLIPTILIIISIYPAAKAEERNLIKLFGSQYLEYQKKVGMFVPKYKSK